VSKMTMDMFRWS